MGQEVIIDKKNKNNIKQTRGVILYNSIPQNRDPSHVHVSCTCSLNVHYTVYCGDQGATIMPGIETAFECTILFSFTFEIHDRTYWSGSTYHTFYKIGCLSVQNTPPPPPVKKSHLRPCLPWQFIKIMVKKLNRTFSLKCIVQMPQIFLLMENKSFWENLLFYEFPMIRKLTANEKHQTFHLTEEGCNTNVVQ